MEKLSLSELKEKRKDIADGITNPSVPENFKPAMKEKLDLIDKRIAELEGVQKTKIVKPKAEPKKVVKKKWEKPTIKVVKQKKEREEPVKTGKQKVVKQKKVKSADKLTSYEKSIIEYTGCSIDEVEEVEDIMRNEIFHSTLDWQDKDLFKQGAKEAYEVYKELKKVTGKKAPEKAEKETPKPEAKDDVSECKKILEAANYDVKEKTVKGKDGGKRKIQTREPRQDRTIIADRTNSVFTTITKSFNSDEEKKENKELLEIVDAVKGLMVKFMNSLDKLVASKDVDKIKKIKELLSKLVD